MPLARLLNVLSTNSVRLLLGHAMAMAMASVATAGVLEGAPMLTLQVDAPASAIPATSSHVPTQPVFIDAGGAHAVGFPAEFPGPGEPPSAASADDLDGDGLPNASDPCPYDPLNDVDGDGLCADVDNCDDYSNPGQQDQDGNGVGDPCDLCSQFLGSGSEPGDLTGYSVDIDGRWAIVGLPGSGPEEAGRAWIYTRIADDWYLYQGLYSADSDAGDLFGSAVAIDADHVVVGAPGDDERAREAGAAYIFEQDGNGTWRQRQKLMPWTSGAPEETRSSAGFGTAVAIEANKLVVGAPSEANVAYIPQPPPNSPYPTVVHGAVYFYVHDGWRYADFDHEIAEPGDRGLGRSLGTDRGVVVAGTESQAFYVYEREGTSFWLWDIVREAEYSFGYSVAISGTTIVAGSPDADGGLGACYSYGPCNQGWCERQRVTALDRQPSRFGYSVSVDDDRLLVGAPQYGGASIGGGAFYHFERHSGEWIQRAERHEYGGWYAPTQMGYSVAVRGTMGVVGRIGPYFTGGSAEYYCLGDLDADGFEDECDNCPLAPNGDQDDFDADGLGDACDDDADGDEVPDVEDECPFNPENDADGDGHCFGEDNCVEHFNPDQADLDGDGVGDPCENCALQGLHHPDPAAGDFFGYAADVDGETLVVSAFGDNSGGVPNTGSADVFVKAGDSWVYQTTLAPSDTPPGSRFGWSVAIDQTTIVVGAPYADGSTGSVYVFARQGTTWSQEARLMAPVASPGMYFGWSVAVQSDRVVVGAIGDGGFRGALYVFQRTGSSWSLETVLTANDGVAYDRLGDSCAIDGDTIAGGSSGHGHPSQPPGYSYDPESGAVYVFTLSGGAWSQQTELNAFDAGVANQQLGYSVALLGNTLLAGAPGYPALGGASYVGALRVFARSGSTWSHEARLWAPELGPGASMGASVALCERSGRLVALAGAPSADLRADDAGAVIAFSKFGATWRRTADFLAPDGAPNDQFGTSFGCDGQTLISGSWGADVPGANSGAAYVFDLLDSDSDGFEDTCDNCRHDSNWDQEDADHDGRGDACENTPPVAGAGGPYTAECNGTATHAQLDGSSSHDAEDDSLDYAWTTDCPGGSFDDATSATPVLTLDSPPPCPVQCTVTVTVTDSAGAQDAESAPVTVSDTQGPVITPPPGGSLECDDVDQAGDAVVTDACDPQPSVDLHESRHWADGECAHEYTLTRTWTATDACGNSSVAAQVLQVHDSTAPVLAGVPSDTTAECHDIPAPAEPTATDNCDPDPDVQLVEDPIDGDCPDSFTLLRTWHATDACGNASSLSQTIHVTDSLPPTLHGMPSSTVVECTAVPAMATVTASDLCDPEPDVTQSEVRTDGPCAGTYVLTRTWTGTDRCGNATSATQVVTVQDTTPPVVQSGSSNLYCLWPPNGQYRRFTRDQFTPVITDACSPPLDWRFTACTSDQADDDPAPNDGATVNDCVVAADGLSFCVRSERDDRIDAGRHYSVTIRATDACGNEGPDTRLGHVWVPKRGADANGCLRPEGCN